GPDLLASDGSKDVSRWLIERPCRPQHTCQMGKEVLMDDELIPGRVRELVEQRILLGDDTLTATIEFHARKVSSVGTLLATSRRRMVAGAGTLGLDNQVLEGVYVSSIVARLVDRRFRNKSASG